MASERGLPRVQYQRTYVLLPPSAHAEWVKAVIDATWDLYRFTVGGSADDAGIGALDDKRVIVVNPDLWDDCIYTFFADYYPGVAVISVYADTPAELAQVLVPGSGN